MKKDVKKIAVLLFIGIAGLVFLVGRKKGDISYIGSGSEIAAEGVEIVSGSEIKADVKEGFCVIHYSLRICCFTFNHLCLCLWMCEV